MKKTLITIWVIIMFIASLPVMTSATSLEIKQLTNGKIDMVPEALPSVAILY